jgi:hypothetical protein
MKDSQQQRQKLAFEMLKRSDKVQQILAAYRVRVGDSPNVDMQSAEEVNAVMQYASVLANTTQAPAFMLYNNQSQFDDWLRNKLKISNTYKATPQQTQQTGNAMAQASGVAAQSQDGGQAAQAQTSQSGGGFGPSQSISPTELMGL